MIGSEKTGRLGFHVGIVRANKKQVNDYFGRANFCEVCQNKRNFV